MFLYAADVDECSSANDSKVCDVNEYCVNIVGSFKCASAYCRLGLFYVAVTCPSRMGTVLSLIIIIIIIIIISFIYYYRLTHTTRFT